MTQGELHLAECAADELPDWLARIGASELLYSAQVDLHFETELQALRERWVDNEVLYREGLAQQVDRASRATFGAAAGVLTTRPTAAALRQRGVNVVPGRAAQLRITSAAV